MNATRLLAAIIMVAWSALLSSCATRSPSGFDLPVETTMSSKAGRGDLLYVPLHLEGGGDLLFILDTGAPLTLLDRSLTPRLGRQFRSEKIISMYGQTPSHYYEESAIYWGEARLCTGRRVLTMDFSRLSNDLTRYTGSSHQVMGVLGMDCLWHYCIQLDFAAQKIRFLNPNQVHWGELGQDFALAPDCQGCPTVVGVRNGRCVIDTGCLGKSATNVLGLDYLARHLVTFDFPDRRMYLKSVGGDLSVSELFKTQPNTALEPTATAP